MGLHHGRQAAFVPFAAFAYFRWNTLRLAVLISSILSIIAAVCLFLPLVTSAETHIHCEGAIECFTLLSINFNAIFLFFLTKRNQTTSEYEEVVEDMDVPPPPYEVAILHSNDQEGLEATISRPMNIIPGGSPNQANINYACIWSLERDCEMWWMWELVDESCNLFKPSHLQSNVLCWRWQK